MLHKNKLTLVLMTIAILVLVMATGNMAQAETSELFISEYIEGGGYNKALEIYNGTGAAVDLSAYTLELYSNGSATASKTLALSGTVAYGDVFVIVHTDAVATLIDQADQIDIANNVVNWNGDDTIVLKKGGAVVDAIGQIGFDPGSQWGTGLVSTEDNTLRRKLDVCAGDTDAADLFDPAGEWDGYAKDILDGIGSHTANCGGTPPVPGQPLPLNEDFDDCTLAGWEIVSVDVDTANTWTCNDTYSNIEANGYGNSAAANEWLITPPLNLNAQENDTLTFRNYTTYSDIDYPQLDVLYSTDYDGGGDPTSASWTVLTGINFSPENSGSWVDSGNVDLSGITGTNVYIAFQYTSSDTGGGSASTWQLDAINVFEQEDLPPSAWIINEIHADPASDITGDANGDGVRHYGDDEFVEIVNNSGVDTDISGWTISDYKVRHTFPSETMVRAGCSVVVFGGDTLTGTFGNSVAQTASTGTLSLNNGGDTVTLSDGVSDIAITSYGSEGGDNQSLTRDPDVTGADPLVKHTLATGSGGTLFSPGTLVDGSKFSGCPTFIHEVQGSGLQSPIIDSTVLIEGIVVGDFQDKAFGTHGDLNGFHVQEEDTDIDDDPLTSEGVFVYDGSSPGTDVAVGDLVKVVGKVSEYYDLTQVRASDVTVVSSGSTLPTAAVAAMPVTSVDDWEAFEGMSINFPETLYVTGNYNQGRYGEVDLSITDRLDTPTNVVMPGAPAIALQAENDLSRIQLEDGLTEQNPDPAPYMGEDTTLRAGDTLDNLTGVLHYGYGLYEVQPTQEVEFTRVNDRTDFPDDVGGTFTVASFNVLNYFTTIDDGEPICGPTGGLDCRGADSDLEFGRQRDKIISAIVALDADVVGLMEIENHPAITEDTPLKNLVDGLNDAVGAGTYAYVDTGSVGTDAIKVAFIYQPAEVSLYRPYAVLDSTVDPTFLDTKNRPVLAQSFIHNGSGEVVTAAVNHLKSKGSDCDDLGDPDTGDGQGNCNLTRTAAADAMVNWLATDPTGSGDPDVLIVGDVNAYAKEDPIKAMKQAGYTDLAGRGAYSYVFYGQAGALDHALSNNALTSHITDATIWHINADEPSALNYNSYNQPELYQPHQFASSDHDPVIAGICETFPPVVTVTVDPDTLWPANHKYVDVTATVSVTDFDKAATITLVSVTSNEPDNGEDDGNTVNDIVIVDNFNFMLRAERSGEGDGRVYTITYMVTDDCGNSTTASAEVTVPLSQAKVKRAAVSFLDAKAPSFLSAPVRDD